MKVGSLASTACLGVLVAVAVTVAAANPSCPSYSDDEVTVHLICHTHDDVGWLKTVDEYFYGAKNWEQRASVQFILDTVVAELQKDERRMFSYVETAFFYRWWNQQTDGMKEVVQGLVASGQLELLNGGWCMNDEAAAYYTDIIDQMTLGLRFLNDTFGTAAHPRVSWQIDPFGHSNEQASLFAQMGFDGLFFGRLDHADKSRRWKDKEMELLWQPSESLGEAASLFTGVLPNGYNPPDGFCFDDTCGDTPMQDDKSLKGYNVDAKVAKFIAEVAAQMTGYRTKHVILTMGSDFQYQNAITWYSNLDKLIKYTRGKSVLGHKLNVVYSTPSCYVDALHATGTSWPTKKDDFFPYSSDPHAYWTGYFTSRPALKGIIRETSSFLQAVKQQYVARGRPYDGQLAALDKALAVAQHHDAVTGTAKQLVTDDYVERLATARDDLQEILGTYDSTHYCNAMNMSSCAFTEGRDVFTVAVYNPVARPQTVTVRLPVVFAAHYTITDHAGKQLPCQVVPVPAPVAALPLRESNATHELVFAAPAVPALGNAFFSVEKRGPALPAVKGRKLKGSHQHVDMAGLSLKFDEISGLLQEFTLQTPKGPRTRKLSQQLMWYAGMAGNNIGFDNRASGAYIFRPNGSVNAFEAPTSIVYEGDVVTEIHQTFSDWTSQVLRKYADQSHIEIEWLVGSIPIGDDIGKEVISRFNADDIDSEDTFYTDANGREMQKRVFNHRETWTLNVTEPIAGNYYPVTSRITVQSVSGSEGYSVLTDRAQGGSSLAKGEAELMLHRRLLWDDAFGVAEPLNETEGEAGDGLVQRGKLLLLHSAMATDDCSFVCLQRLEAERILSKPVVSLADPMDTLPAPTSALTLPLPAQVHLLTLTPLAEAGDELLLRLEHMFEAGEDASLSTPVMISLKNLLVGKTISSARETTLSANQWLDEATRLTWKVEANAHSPRSFHPKFTHPLDSLAERSAKEGNLVVTLNPMEIRTFVVTLSGN